MLHQTFHRNVGVLDHGQAAINDLRQIVRRHVCGHTDGNTRGTIDQQSGNLGRQDRGFGQAVVEVVGQVHRLFIEIRQHLLGDFPKPGLGVTHGRRIVAINGTKVSLTIYHGIAHGPVLGQTNHGVVNRAVTVWVILTQHLSYDSC